MLKNFRKKNAVYSLKYASPTIHYAIPQYNFDILPKNIENVQYDPRVYLKKEFLGTKHRISSTDHKNLTRIAKHIFATFKIN